MVDIVVAVIEAVYSFLWDDLITVPLPGGGTIGFSLLVILLIPAGIFFTIRTRFLPVRLFPDMIRATVRNGAGEKVCLPCRLSWYLPQHVWGWEIWSAW